jgi:DNA-binding NarL/FixJ family response regulator
MTAPDIPIQILLLDDDEDDYVLVRSMLSSAFGEAVHLDWYQKDHVSTDMICSGIYTVTLVDYLLGPLSANGVEVIQKAKGTCPDAVVFLFTGWRDQKAINLALEAGANGHISKDEVSVQHLKEVLLPFLPHDKLKRLDE